MKPERDEAYAAEVGDTFGDYIATLKTKEGVAHVFDDGDGLVVCGDKALLTSIHQWAEQEYPGRSVRHQA